MSEKRMISDYEVIHSIDFGSRELVIGEDIDNKDGLYYLVAYGERNELFERYDKCVVGDDFAEIMEIFATRLSEEAQKLRAEHDKLAVPDAMAFIKPGDCTPLNYTDNLKGRVIVIKPEVLRPEHRQRCFVKTYMTAPLPGMSGMMLWGPLNARSFRNGHSPSMTI